MLRFLQFKNKQISTYLIEGCQATVSTPLFCHTLPADNPIGELGKFTNTKLSPTNRKVGVALAKLSLPGIPPTFVQKSIGLPASLPITNLL